jgi:lipoyl(octanoyl) transferase
MLRRSTSILAVTAAAAPILKAAVPAPALTNAVQPRAEQGLTVANPLWIVPLGKTNYDACHALQMRVFEAKTKPIRDARLSRRQRDGGDHLPDVIFVTEHSHPLYTMGRRDTSDGFRTDKLRDNIKQASKDKLTVKSSAAALELLGKPCEDETCVRQILRGGGLTWHGPGQAVVYPIVEYRYYWQMHPLHKRGTSPLHWMTEQLEQAMISTCMKGFGIQAHVSKVGVWVPVDSAPNGEAKIGFVGLHASEQCTMHGCSLNVQNDLDGFEGIEMCEMPQHVPTAIQTEVAKWENEMGHNKSIGFTEDRVAKVGTMVADNLVELLWPRDAGEPHVTRFQSPKDGLDAVLDTFK